MTPGEMTYVRKLVRNIISRGHYISINDGEEWCAKHTRKEDVIFDNVGACDEEWIRIEDDDGNKLGTFFIVYGNDHEGSEVVCDYTANRLCDTIWREVFGWPMEDQLEFIIPAGTK